jgi:hypothetical protein
VRLCLLAKWPVPGRVKTRLMSALGEDGAAELARVLLDDAVLALTVRGRPLVALEGAPQDVELLSPFDRAEVIDQGGGDLGARMVRVLARACEAAPSAAVLGSDVVGLSPDRLDEAEARLVQSDLVLGPTLDGGYYLLGARRTALDALAPALTGVRFGTPHALGDTLAGAERERLSFALLPSHFDVDEPADLDRLRAHVATHPELAPHTARWLSRRTAGVDPEVC